MDTGQVGPPGACAVRHVVTARGLKHVLVLTQLRLREASHVREVVSRPGFVIYDNVQVCLIKCTNVKGLFVTRFGTLELTANCTRCNN